jgi:hypothetical protein
VKDEKEEKKAKASVRWGRGGSRGLSSSRRGSSLQLDAEDLEVAGLGGYAIAGAGDGEGDDRQVSTAVHLSSS